MELQDIGEQYNKDLITELNTTKILNSGDMEKLEKSMPMIKRAMIHSQMFRTETEAHVSVLQDIKHPTADSKYWQSMKELNVMADQLCELNFRYKEKLKDIELLEWEISQYEDELDVPTRIEKEKKEIELEREKYRLVRSERVAQDRIREIDMWKNIIEKLEPLMNYSKEDVNQHQLISYAARFTNETVAQIQRGAKLGPGEARNAMGLLLTTLKTVKDKGKVEEFKQQLGPVARQFIEGNEQLKQLTYVEA